MSHTPLISIIIPSYNQGNFIEETIKSVLDLNYDNIEFIVVDGGSTDLSRDIVTTFFQQKSIKTRGLRCHLICSSKGRSKQMNAGANAATGGILYFLHNFLVNIFKFGGAGGTALSLTAGAIGSIVPVFGTAIGLITGGIVAAGAGLIIGRYLFS